MKVYIATRYKGAENRHEVEQLSKAVRNAGLHDFSFVRDVENYKQTFDDPKELWRRAYDEIGACDAFLVDVSDNPTGGRLVEAGMAYAMGKTVIVIKRHGVHHKQLFDGIARTVITYDNYEDLAKQLKRFDKDRTFDVTDKSALLVMLLLVGGVIAYFLAQVWIPLAGIGAIAYWLLMRHFISLVRDFDRVVIYIPLVIIWGSVYFWLSSISMTIALAWAVVYWIVVLFVLARIKFAL